MFLQGTSHAISGRNVITGNPSELSQINAVQVASINEGQSRPMLAVDNLDDVLMERIGNRSVNSSLRNQAIQSYYPADNGATISGWKNHVLRPGDMFDRYGHNYGTFVGEAGTPMPMRALPPANNGVYNAYEVLQPIPVMRSTIAPAFGQPGGGIQYKLPLNIYELKSLGYIRNIKP